MVGLCRPEGATSDSSAAAGAGAAGAATAGAGAGGRAPVGERSRVHVSEALRVVLEMCDEVRQQRARKASAAAGWGVEQEDDFDEDGEGWGEAAARRVERPAARPKPRHPRSLLPRPPPDRRPSTRTCNALLAALLSLGEIGAATKARDPPLHLTPSLTPTTTTTTIHTHSSPALPHDPHRPPTHPSCPTCPLTPPPPVTRCSRSWKRAWRGGPTLTRSRS